MKLKIPYSQDLFDFLNEELENNFEVEGHDIIIYCHSPEDAFSVGTDFGKWQSSTKRLGQVL